MAITILKRIEGNLETLALLLGLVFLNAGVADYFALSALLMTMTSGIIISNFYNEELFKGTYARNHRGPPGKEA